MAVECSFIESLPNELLHQIVSSLSADPPSIERVREQPRPDLLTKADRVNLKYLSSVSSRFRNLVLPTLFTYSCVHAEQTDCFLAFIRQTGLAPHVRSIVTFVHGSFSTAADDRNWWCRILDPLRNLTRVVVVASPVGLGEMTATNIFDGYAWAFDIECQILQLEQKQPSLHRQRQRSWASRSLLVGNPQNGDKYCLSASLTSDDHEAGLMNILNARCWDSMTFNESSFLRAFKHYEYFLFRIPSLLDIWGRLESLPKDETTWAPYASLPPSYPVEQQHLTNLQNNQSQGLALGLSTTSPSPPPPPLSAQLSCLTETPTELKPLLLPPLQSPYQHLTALQNLTSFHYTSIFPFYNHIGVVLNAIEKFMPNLRTLSMQLAPTRGNRVIETEQRSSIDPNDPWMELSSAYSIIAHTVHRWIQPEDQQQPPPPHIPVSFSISEAHVAATAAGDNVDANDSIDRVHSSHPSLLPPLLPAVSNPASLLIQSLPRPYSLRVFRSLDFDVETLRSILGSIINDVLCEPDWLTDERGTWWRE